MAVSDNLNPNIDLSFWGSLAVTFLREAKSWKCERGSLCFPISSSTVSIYIHTTFCWRQFPVFDCGDGSTLHNMFLFRADEIYRCDALQSPSVHHRIDWREWPCSGGLSPSRITHEPQHDWSLLTTPESVPYSQSQHIVPPLPEKKLETLFFFSFFFPHLSWGQNEKTYHLQQRATLILNLEFSQSYFCGLLISLFDP